MKRSELVRRTPLTAGAATLRRSPISPGRALRRSPMPRPVTRADRDPLWTPARLAAVDRDRGCCVKCGRFVGPSIDVHHRVLLGMGGSMHNPDRHRLLVCLDRACHDAVHADRDVAREFGYIVDQGNDPTLVAVRTCAGWVRQGQDGRMTELAR